VQTLLPAYRFSIILQQTKSSIRHVKPLILIRFDEWKRVSLTSAAKQFRDFLIKAFEYKFDNELNSNVYTAAAALESASLVCWFRNEFSEHKVLLLNDALKACAFELAKKKIELERA
jgi:hypothetical protein